jgi:hypothetical protein
MLIAVRAVARQGYQGVFRAGRMWPSGEDTVVEVFDQDDDPTPFDTIKIGRRSLIAIEQDARLAIRTDVSALAPPVEHVHPIGEPLSEPLISTPVETKRGARKGRG